MATKRVFAHEFNTNYNDYLKNKNGEEMLKNRKTKKVIQRFINYNEFMLLTKSYYKHFRCGDVCSIQALPDLYNSNESFVVYENVLSHIGKCDYCTKNIHSLCHLECKDLSQVLYPYGEFIAKHRNNYRFLSHLDLDKWCIDKPKLCHIDNYIDTNLVNNLDSNNCGKKYGMCKATKPLFQDCNNKSYKPLFPDCREM
jgi:hypothetical protein